MGVRAEGTALRRDLLERVLEAVRALGTASSLDEVLQQVVEDVVDLLGFRATALNVRAQDDRLYVKAVAGPDGVKELLHSSASVQDWQNLLAVCRPVGGLLFLDHALADDPAVAAVEEWVEERPPEPVPAGPDKSWHARDTLLGPLRRPDGELIGVLSADLEVGQVQDPQQRLALELFVAQAARALTDAQARERLEGLRRDAERRWRLVWESGLVAAGVLDEAGTIVDVNEAGARSLGWPAAELVGRGFLDVVPDELAETEQQRFDLREPSTPSFVSERVLLARDGRRIWCDLHAAVVVEGEDHRRSYIVQWTDVTARKLAEQRMVHQLRHDPVTDLPNRRALEELLADLAGRAVPFGLLYCDIDGFRGIADSLGHDAGDALLRGVAHRLRDHLEPGATIFRLAGDEFVVCLPGSPELLVTATGPTTGSAADDAVHDPADAAVDDAVDDAAPEAKQAVARAAARLAETLDEPFPVAGRDHLVRMSIGVSVARTSHEHPIDVLREADQALRRAKRRGRSRIEVFDTLQDRTITRGDMELEHALRAAVAGGVEFEPHYQAVISLNSGATVGYEALLRWRRPDGLMLPDRFLPIAERAGLSAALGWRTLDLVAASPPTAAPSKLGRPWIAINVSAAQLGRGLMVQALERVLDTGFGGDPTGLHIEITETSLLEAAPATIDELYEVADLGVGIALDDFGTGYSSLTLLRDLPVSVIKIDRSFIVPIAVDLRARTIVRHTIELCRGLGLATIAEGIETHEQLAWLQTLGCEFGQGYLIDRPAPWPFDIPGQVDPEPPRRFTA